MALLHAIGFEWATHEDNISGSNYVSYSTTQKRSGNYSINISLAWTELSNSFYLPLAASLSEFFVQFAFYFTSNPTGAGAIIAWRNGTTTLGGIRLNASRKLDVYTGNFATLVASGNTILNINTWYVIEVHVKIADSGGVIEVRLDMNNEASFSGDTKPGAETQVNGLVFGNVVGSDAYVDDLLVHDVSGTVNNSWPNGAKVVLLKPNADGGTLGWTPTPSGSHYTTVDEVPPSGTDYLQATEADKVDQLGLTDLPAEALSVKGVIIQAWAYKGCSLPPTRLALGLNLGGVDYYTADKDLGTSQALVREVWEQKPGGGAFSVADVNGAKLLLKSRA